MRSVSLKAPAKINLFLDIVSRRRDGYHNLLTVFAKISLFDSLEISRSAKDGIFLSVKNSTEGIEKEDNLAYKAAKIFMNKFRITQGVKIRLEKKIPCGAGLGGGSSDAAAVLRGLARLFKIDRVRNRKKLLNISVKLGSDVPFFLFDETFCMARGKGEKLKPLKVRPRKEHIVVACPEKPVNTKSAYLGVKICRQAERQRRRKIFLRLKKSLVRGDFIAGNLFNGFEDSIVPVRKDIGKLKKEFRKLEAKDALMSGSGSCVFGLFDSLRRARNAARRLKTCKNKVFLAKFL